MDDDAPLEQKIWTRFTDTERQRVRQAAAELGVSESVLGRALWRYGLDHLTDPDLRVLLDEENRRLAAARRRAGQATAHKRWGTPVQD